MIDELLVSFLRADAGINSAAAEIAVGVVPVDADGEPLTDEYIWISNYDEEDLLDLDGEAGLTHYRFDIEVCGDDEVAVKGLARLVKKRLQGHSGDFGIVDGQPGVAEAIYVESKDEDYIPVNRFENEALTVVAMDVRITADDSQDDS